MRIVVVAGLSDHKLSSKIAPILAMDGVAEVLLVRRYPLEDRSVRNVNPPRWMQRRVLTAEAYRVLSLLLLCLRRPRPDVVVGIYMIPHGIYAGAIGRLLRIPWIQLIIGTDLAPTLSSGLLTRLLRGANFVGSRGPESAARLVAHGIPPGKIFCPPNVFNVDRYVIAEDSNTRREYDLIFVGSLVPVKRVHVLIEAVHILREDYPDIRLLIVGDGPLRGQVEDLVGCLNLAAHVKVSGRIPHERISECLRRSRIFVMTSESEGLPMAMLEALSCGLPVVMPNVGDISRVAHHGENGLLLSPGTPENFAEAVRVLLSDQELYRRLQRGAMATRERFRRENSLEAAVTSWEEILGRINI